MQQFFGYMLTAFWQVVMLAIMIAVGFAADKIGIFRKPTAVACNNLLFYIITPMMIVNSFLNVELTAENGIGFLAAVGIAVAFHAVMALVIRPLYRKAGEDRPIFRFGTMFGNVGYMGLPLAGAVAGDLGVFYCSAAVAVFNVFAFTYGVRLMKQTREPLHWKKLVINPGMIGIVIGLPLFLLNVTPPDAIATPIRQIGSMNTPLAMLMFGTYLAHTDLLEMFRRKENYIAAVLKLLIVPVTAVLLLRLIGVHDELLLAAAVFTAAPCANNTVMFSAKYGRDTGVASKLCGFTTVLSILTMPVCIALANVIG